MMKKSFFMLAALVCSQHLLQAQKVAALNDSAITIEEVVVNASKRQLKQSDLGKVVTIITKQDLERQQGKTVTQILNETAGITINGALNNLGTNQSLFVRGGSNGRTLILVDGIPVNDPSQIVNEFDLNMLNTNMIERIEILRGAQSTLYGSDAVAGVINFITVPNKNGKLFNGKLGGTVGNFGKVDVFGQINGTLGKKLHYNVKANRLQNNGFSAAYDSTDKKKYDNDSYNYNNITTQLEYEIDNHFKTHGFVTLAENKFKIDKGAFTDEKDYDVNNKNLLTGLGLQYKTKRVRLVSNFQYNDAKRNFLDDSISRPLGSFYSDKYYGKSQFAELFGNFDVAKGLSLLVGYDWRRGTMNNKGLSIFSPFPPFPFGIRDTTASQKSIYGSIFYTTNNNKFTVEAGVRTNKHSRYGNNTTFTLNPNFKINDNWRIFASIATAFKAPTLYQLFSSSGNKNLNPERSNEKELGLVYSKNNNNIRVVYFNRNVDSVLDFNNNTFKYFNTKNQKVSGLEIENRFEVSKNFSVNSNFTFLSPTENSQSRATFKDTTHNYLLRRPKFSANVALNFKLTEKLFVTTDLKHVGKRYDVGGYKKADVLLEAYTLFGANANYLFNDKITFFANTQNLFNTKFFDIRGYNSIPRLLNIGANIRL